MPYINVKLAGSLTREQKDKIAKEITDTMERIAHKPKSYTYIVFDEVAEENWAVAGELLAVGDEDLAERGGRRLDGERPGLERAFEARVVVDA